MVLNALILQYTNALECINTVDQQWKDIHLHLKLPLVMYTIDNIHLFWLLIFIYYLCNYFAGSGQYHWEGIDIRIQQLIQLYILLQLCCIYLHFEHVLFFSFQLITPSVSQKGETVKKMREEVQLTCKVLRFIYIKCYSATMNGWKKNPTVHCITT